MKNIKKTIWLTGDEASIFPEVLTVFPDSISERWNDNRAFSLTWPPSMQIYGNKRKCLHKKGDQLAQDWFGTPTWPPFYCFGTPIWRRDVRWKRFIERFRIMFTSNCTTWILSVDSGHDFDTGISFMMLCLSIRFILENLFPNLRSSQLEPLVCRLP